MIRALFMIAIAGFVLSVGSFAAAVAIGGPDAIARSAWGWNWSNGHWGWDDDDNRGSSYDARGPSTSREIAWSGGDEVEFDVRADVTYTQAPGPAKLVVTGPQGVVDRVIVDGQRVHFRGRTSYARLNIVMTAPNVTSFGINGSDRLTIENYSQDRLSLDLSGSAEVTARGRARDVSIDISGSGEAHLGELKAEAAVVDISGSGEATIAPTQSAKLDISGSGEVTLLTRPARLESDVSGSGTIRQGTAEQSSASPSPSPSPSPSDSPFAEDKKL